MPNDAFLASASQQPRPPTSLPRLPRQEPAVSQDRFEIPEVACPLPARNSLAASPPHQNDLERVPLSPGGNQSSSSDANQPNIGTVPRAFHRYARIALRTQGVRRSRQYPPREPVQWPVSGSLHNRRILPRGLEMPPTGPPWLGRAEAGTVPQFQCTQGVARSSHPFLIKTADVQHDAMPIMYRVGQSAIV